MEADGSMTLTGHLEELRNRLIICAVVFVVSVVITLTYADRLIDILTAMGQGYYTFVSIAPQEKLMQYFRVSLLAAFVITVPVALYQIYAFAKPGLKKAGARFSSSWSSCLAWHCSAWACCLLQADDAVHAPFPEHGH